MQLAMFGLIKASNVAYTVNEVNAMSDTKPNVTVYVTSWCPSVRLARNFLNKRNIEYTEIDIEKTPGAAEQVEQWTGGYRTVPTFNIDGAIVIDFDRAALEDLLGPAQ